MRRRPLDDVLLMLLRPSEPKRTRNFGARPRALGPRVERAHRENPRIPLGKSHIVREDFPNYLDWRRKDRAGGVTNHGFTAHPPGRYCAPTRGSSRCPFAD